MPAKICPPLLSHTYAARKTFLKRFMPVAGLVLMRVVPEMHRYICHVYDQEIIYVQLCNCIGCVIIFRALQLVSMDFEWNNSGLRFMRR